MFGGNMSTEGTPEVIGLLLNCTELNFRNRVTVDGVDNIKCPQCNLVVDKNISLQLILSCQAVPRSHEMKWLNNKDFTENLIFLKELLTKLDEL